MIHKLTIGHFDIEALKAHRVVVLRPIDMTVVSRLVREVGEITESGRLTLGGHAVEVYIGYIVCPWLMPSRNKVAEEFAKRLCQEVGCVMYDDSRRETVTPEQFAEW
ncbi:hypothetical protein [Frigoriglobus tundricola]|uniref:Uncharacterized protein n=1 Tax=Frigoriglobus tundricola TaxID=2774151 RepID=A0A6M5YIH5_9BACT|nr:hypothetical protein [Frigoriglobus tundricola]QJW93121.1 hypothetical protein FTUN_0624 [Frigoriglobus tundricola]